MKVTSQVRTGTEIGGRRCRRRVSRAPSCPRFASLLAMSPRPCKPAQRRQQPITAPVGQAPHTFSAPPPEAEKIASPAVVIADERDWSGQLARELLRLAAVANQQPGTPIQITFHGGRIEGVVGQVTISEGRVKCRFRARAAEMRRRLAGTGIGLAARLRAGGLHLEALEVES